MVAPSAAAALAAAVLGVDTSAPGPQTQHMCPAERYAVPDSADPPVSQVGRVMLVLTALHRADRSLPLVDLAHACGLPKSSTHRLAEELCRYAALERTDGGYRLGMRLFELGSGVPTQRVLRDAALPLMADLREATRCTVHLAVLDGVDVVYVQILTAPDGIRLPSRLGGRLPAHATGVGKAMMAFADPAVTDARIQAGLPRLTPRTIASPGALRRELEKIRTNGIAFDREESALGVLCIAVPILDPDGRAVAALSVTGRSTREVTRIAPAARTVGLTLGRLLATLTPAHGPAGTAI